MSDRIPLIFACLDMVRVEDHATGTLWDFDPEEAQVLARTCADAVVSAAKEGQAILQLRGLDHCRALSVLAGPEMCWRMASQLMSAADEALTREKRSATWLHARHRKAAAE